MRRFPLKTTIAVLVLAGLGTAGWIFLPGYFKGWNKKTFRHAKVSRGEIRSVVNATGTLKPVLSVSVGAVVSGPIERVYVDYNQDVKQGDLLAKIDPRLFKAAVLRDKAQLETRKADLKRTEALLTQAKNDERRAIALYRENPDFISDAEMDQFHYNRMSLEAQLRQADAAIKSAEATLTLSETNLVYTKIASPVDGIIIERKIDEGQSLASQFQTPEMFIVGLDMRKRMHIMANVDEADLGLIYRAKLRGPRIGPAHLILQSLGAQALAPIGGPMSPWAQTLIASHLAELDAFILGSPVRFTIDAYPGELFTGRIEQIRMNSTTTQNVVTYPVVIQTANPDLKLKPGMTANLSFQVDEAKNVLRIPNAALRFYPDIKEVRPEDRYLLEGAQKNRPDSDDQTKLTARQKAELRAKRNQRHVWVEDGDYLRAIALTTGLSDNRYTQITAGELREGQKLVTGIKR